MLTNPADTDDLTVLAYPFQIVESEELVLIKRAGERIVISGDHALSSVLLLLSKCSAVPCKISDILNSFPSGRRDDMYSLINQMLKERFLVSDPVITADDLQNETKEDVFFWQLGKNRSRTINSINRYTISIIGLNELSGKMYSAVSNSLGIKKENICLVDYPLLRNKQLQESFGQYKCLDYNLWKNQYANIDEHLVIALAPYGGQELLMDINSYCCQNSSLLLPLIIQNTKSQIGPIINPGKSACLECLRQRQNANMPNSELERMHERYANDGQDIAALHPSLINMSVELSAFELLKYLGQLTDAYTCELIEFDLLNTKITRHKPIRFPFCKVCQKL